MTLQKGWINRQFARVERDVQSWPSWMRREAEVQTAPALEPSRSTGAGQQEGTEAHAGETAVRTEGAVG
jgi:hypothetical protein